MVMRKYLPAAVWVLAVTLLPQEGPSAGVIDARASIAIFLEEYERHGAFSLPTLVDDEIHESLAGKPDVRNSMDHTAHGGGDVSEMGVAGEPDIRQTRAFIEHREAALAHDAGQRVAATAD